MTGFEALGLAQPILRALADARHSVPTPIQIQAIPPVMAGRDLVGIAQTGTGKTAAFVTPILHRQLHAPIKPERKSVRALILAPTRELAAQIVASVRAYGRHMRLSVALAIGGVSINPQIKALAHGVDVLVATPGRLIDLKNQNAVRLDRVEVLVLDEADQMLDMGFIHAIRTILAAVPARRQSLMFSATMPKEIEALAARMLHDPVRVAVTPVAKTADRVEQRVIHVEKPHKGALLAEVLRAEPVDRALVFTRTKHGADKVVRGLDAAGLSAAAIHGNKSQNQRERTLAAFRSGEVRVLVATDIAARGLDIAGVSHVVNYDLPNVPESYVHRIGRTARAGAAGIAISFCDGEERPYLKAIEVLIRGAIPATDMRRHGAAERPSGGRPAPDRPAPDRQAPDRPAHGRPAGRPKPARGARPGRPDRGERPADRDGRGADKAGDLAGVGFLRPKRRGKERTTRAGGLATR